MPKTIRHRIEDLERLSFLDKKPAQQKVVIDFSDIIDVPSIRPDATIEEIIADIKAYDSRLHPG